MTYVASNGTTAPLDNPLWASLATLHRGLALGGGGLLRYPADVAPFIAVPNASPLDPAALAELVPEGDTVLFFSVIPEPPRGFAAEPMGRIVQMVCDASLSEGVGPTVVPLDEAWRPAVLDLTAKVYPHYFRPRTMELGRYRGVVDGTRLLAMAGERMGFPGAREISAICTQPDATGRGLARRLLAAATNEQLARGDAPFLHVSPENTRAFALYERSGYRVRTELPLVAMRRVR